VKKGSDVILASLHGSVCEGEWAGRFLRKDIFDKLGDTVGNQGDEMKSQLLHLREWACKTYTSLNIADESKLDSLMNAARCYVNTLDGDMLQRDSYNAISREEYVEVYHENYGNFAKLKSSKPVACRAVRQISASTCPQVFVFIICIYTAASSHYESRVNVYARTKDMAATLAINVAIPALLFHSIPTAALSLSSPLFTDSGGTRLPLFTSSIEIQTTFVSTFPSIFVESTIGTGRVTNSSYQV
jgi:hypothetical protein